MATLHLIVGHNRPLKLLNNRDRFLAACRCSPVDRPPVWLMRQAGRALPEYRALKEKHTFVDLVQTPELAAEVTLQPIRRFDFDAAVLFSDILVIPEAMGQPYHFRNGGGIEMEFAIRTAEDIRKLDHRRVGEKLRYVSEALRFIKPALDGRTALLGFAGSPWTLANYMIEGGSSHAFTRAKSLYYTEPLLFFELMEKLTLAVTEFLKLQITSGVDAVQLFDSSGGLLADNAFDAASGRWMRQIIASLDNRVPVILFSKGTHGRWKSLVATGANILSLDWTQPLAEVRALLPGHVGVQGNLDPALLSTTPEIVATETARILKSMRGQTGHIFNLGHGVAPSAKLECIQALVSAVRDVP
ncbi:MAG: uroporphyrinogen decarboxylase [Methylacidiphilales bacterium]|nr:uroporphyrinogen decarboxylase [Candidatus Methylacidiphilales bacterium]